MKNRNLTTMSEVFATSVEAMVDEDFTLEEAFMEWLTDSPTPEDLARLVAYRLSLEFTPDMARRCYSYEEVNRFEYEEYGQDMYA